MRSWALGRLAAATVAVAALCAMAGRAEAGYIQTNLVSDISGLAELTDPELVNPWGISYSTTSPVWVSDQGTNFATLYAVTTSLGVTKTVPAGTDGNIAIPTTATGPQGPTGQVSNVNASSFLVGNGGNGAFAHFIFANLNGTISAWNSGTTAFVQPAATTAGAVFTGLAINQAQTMLYAANNAAGTIDVFNSSFMPISLGSTAFANPFTAQGLTPFNVQDINGEVYVTYAPSSLSGQENAGPGAGGVAVFDENGNLLSDFTASQLAAPWGIALAPASGFGQFSGDLLVGNFSYLYSEINAFDPMTGEFLGSIPIDVGAGNTPGGLWALGFGVGGSNGDPDILFFTDGVNGQTDGLFGAFTVPEPSALSLLAAALVFLGVWRFDWHKPRRA